MREKNRQIMIVYRPLVMIIGHVITDFVRARASCPLTVCGTGGGVERRTHVCLAQSQRQTRRAPLLDQGGVRAKVEFAISPALATTMISRVIDYG